jgi:tetratricopeptide (TPR) repeat protein
MLRNETIIPRETSGSIDKARSHKKKRGFPHRLWSADHSSFSMTSVEEDEESTLASASSSNNVIRRTSVLLTSEESLPLEVEVVYDSDSESSDQVEYEQRKEGAASIPVDTALAAAQDEDDDEDSTPLRHFQKALDHVSINNFDQSLRHVEDGLALVNQTNPLYKKLLTIKAEVLGRQGDYEASLQTYQRVLEEEDAPPDILASLCFACGRLSVYLKDYLQALDYYTQELLLTRAISGDSLAVARIYHDLAKVAEKGLGDWTQALVYYEQALFVEYKVWKRAKEDYDDDKQRQDDLQEAQQQIPETKKCMGRIQFANGNIEEALRLSNHRFSLD